MAHALVPQLTLVMLNRHAHCMQAQCLASTAEDDFLNQPTLSWPCVGPRLARLQGNHHYHRDYCGQQELVEEVRGMAGICCDAVVEGVRAVGRLRFSGTETKQALRTTDRQLNVLVRLSNWCALPVPVRVRVRARARARACVCACACACACVWACACEWRVGVRVPARDSSVSNRF